MAKCPKCGYKLKIYDISQNCPKCKVNLRFYNFEENFYRNAKQVELSGALFHTKVRRLKAAFIGSKLIIFRLILSLLPLITLLVPAGSFHIDLPYKSADISMGLLGVVNLVMGSELGFVMGMGSSEFAGAEFTAVVNSLISYAIPVIFSLAVFISTILCFVSIKKMQKVICSICALGIASSIAAQIMVYICASSLIDSIIVTGKGGFGLFITVIGFAVVFAVNLKLHKDGIPVEYDEGMCERVEILKKVKLGEINIDDLPQPVVETAETRAIEEEILKEEESVVKALEEKAQKEAEIK